jgi:predicted metallopeptidase
MPKTEFAHAEEVRLIAEKLIALFHPHLRGIRIEYVFLSEPPMSQGRALAGRARKVSGLNAYLATPDFEGPGESEPFFVIEITQPTWDKSSFRWRVALVDHELKHCGVDELSGDLYIVPHDEEEFDDIVERHGAWEPGLDSFAKKLAHGQAEPIDIETVFASVMTYGAIEKTKRTPARIDLRWS